MNHLCSQSMGHPTVCQQVSRLGYAVCSGTYPFRSYPLESPDASAQTPLTSPRQPKDSPNRKHKYTYLPLSTLGVAGSHTPARRMPRTKRFGDARKANLADANYRSVYIQNHTREHENPLSHIRARQTRQSEASELQPTHNQPSNFSVRLRHALDLVVGQAARAASGFNQPLFVIESGQVL